MNELKAGDSTSFQIGEWKLEVEPMPFGKLKKLVKIVASAAKKLAPGALKDDLLSVVPALVEEYIADCIPLLFDDKKHPFLNEQWIDDHMTVPKLKEILIAAVTVNGLGDFFLKTVRRPAPTTVAEDSSGTTETPSESIGSTTSSGSPTDGAPKI